MRSSKLAQFVFIAILAIRADGQAQLISEPVGGESYFANDLTISFQQDVAPQKLDLVQVFESPSPQSIFGSKSTREQFFPVCNNLAFWRSQNALRSFVTSSNDFQLPLSFEWNRSTFLLARWEGRKPLHKPTKTFPENKRRDRQRPDHDHVELVWSPSGFQLNFYEDRDDRVRKCIWFPPAVLVETVPLTVHSHQSCLVLCPNKNVGVLPLFVILSENGDAQLSINPIGGFGEFKPRDNNVMHTKPDLRVLFSACRSIVPAR